MVPFRVGRLVVSPGRAGPTLDFSGAACTGEARGTLEAHYSVGISETDHFRRILDLDGGY